MRVTATVRAINAPTLDELDIVMVQTAYADALARSPLAQTSRLAYRNRITGVPAVARGAPRARCRRAAGAPDA